MCFGWLKYKGTSTSIEKIFIIHRLSLKEYWNVNDLQNNLNA